METAGGERQRKLEIESAVVSLSVRVSGEKAGQFILLFILGRAAVCLFLARCIIQFGVILFCLYRIYMKASAVAGNSLGRFLLRKTPGPPWDKGVRKVRGPFQRLTCNYRFLEPAGAAALY